MADVGRGQVAGILLGCAIWNDRKADDTIEGGVRCLVPVCGCIPAFEAPMSTPERETQCQSRTGKKEGLDDDANREDRSRAEKRARVVQHQAAGLGASEARERGEPGRASLSVRFRFFFDPTRFFLSYSFCFSSSHF